MFFSSQFILIFVADGNSVRGETFLFDIDGESVERLWTMDEGAGDGAWSKGEESVCILRIERTVE